LQDFAKGFGADFEAPPFEPSPSQYACPLPSMIAPGADVIVTFLPPKVIGSKELELVNPNVVKPANVTVELAFTFERSIAELLGAAMFWSAVFVHEATAVAI
jgi:hypothetical protein